MNQSLRLSLSFLGNMFNEVDVIQLIEAFEVDPNDIHDESEFGSSSRFRKTRFSVI